MNASAVMSYLASREWVMDPQQLRAIADRVAAGLEAASPADLQASKDDEATAPKGPGYDLRDGAAHIRIEGPILKEVPCVMRWLGVKATSTRATESAIDAALYDPEVKSIALDIDSPGGSLDGTQDLADAIYAARGLKPVTAHASGMMASAALWIGAQADSVTAGETTMVGSVGVFRVYEDSSEAAAKRGIRVNVVSSHELKGAGVPGTPLTDAQRADAQRIVDEATDIFVNAIARGRGMDAAKVRALATGQVWFGADAMARGLIDGVSTMRTAHTVADPLVSVTTAAQAVAQETETMSEKTTGTTGATVDTERLTKLEADLAAANAKSAALEAIAKAAEDRERAALLVKYENRIAPSSLAAISEFAAKTTPAKLEEFLAAQSVITRAERVSNATDAATATSAEAVDPTATRALAKVFGQTETRLHDMVKVGDEVERVEHEARADENGRVTMIPMAVLKDGSRVERSELRRRLSLKGALAGLVFALFAGNAHAAALSAARATECKDMGGYTKAYLMKASTTIYAGGLVMLDSNGVALPAAASASNNGVVGVAQETKTSAASGSYWIGVSGGTVCKFAGTTLAQTGVGDLVYAEDDQTVDETASANEPIAGILVQYVSASVGWVLLGVEFAIRDAVTSDPTTYTGDLTLSGGASALTFTDTASSIVLPDNDTTALLIGSTDQLGFVTIDTGDGTETLQINGTAGQQSVHVDEGTVTLDETLTVGSSISLSDGLTIDQSANNVLSIAENSEDIEVTFSGNAVGLSSTTGVVAFDFGALIPKVTGTGATGSVVAGANTACNTTCTHSCLFGFDDGAADAETLVACDDATADKCLCLGPN